MSASEASAARAALLLEAGRPAAALEEAGRALARDPGDPGATMVASSAARQDGDLESALRFAERAVALTPGDADAWAVLAAAQHAIEPARAIDAAIHRTRLAPADWVGHAALAEIASEVPPARDLAIQAAEHAVRLGPDQSGAHLVLGTARLASNRRRPAIAAFRTALRLDPQSETARHNLALALAEGSSGPRAVRELARMSADAPASTLLRHNLAVVAGSVVAWPSTVVAGAAIISMNIPRMARIGTATGTDVEAVWRTAGGWIAVGIGAALLGMAVAIGVQGGTLAVRAMLRAVSRDPLLRVLTVANAVALAGIAVAPALPIAGAVVAYGVAAAGCVGMVVLTLLRILAAQRRRASLPPDLELRS